ncbi:MAG: hypothetical protein JWR83_3457 [Aeromicrobium sp.]|nr:hypothetical protein [Aeromicrobium sp.]
MAIHTQDPAVEWADLLQELVGKRRDAAVSALRQSAESGWPASRESVITLVAYAQGRITADEYAVQTLVSLGLADARTAPLLLREVAAPAPQPTPEPVPLRRIPSSLIDATAGSEFLSNRPLEQLRRDA